MLPCMFWLPLVYAAALTLEPRLSPPQNFHRFSPSTSHSSTMNHMQPSRWPANTIFPRSLTSRTMDGLKRRAKSMLAIFLDSRRILISFSSRIPRTNLCRVGACVRYIFPVGDVSVWLALFSCTTSSSREVYVCIGVCARMLYGLTVSSFPSATHAFSFTKQSPRIILIQALGR